MGRGTIAVTLLITLGLAIGLFVLLPLFLAGVTARATIGPGQTLLEHLARGPHPGRRLRRLPARGQPLGRDPARVPVPRR